MRKRFWALIVDVKIAERYYWYYIEESKRYDYVFSGICLLVSAASISAWYIWKRLPGLWAVFAGGAQVVSTLKPLFPYSKRVKAATYVQQDIQGLLIDMEAAWNRYGDSGRDEKIRELITGFEKRLMDTENRFAPPELFPVKKALHDKAQQEAQVYFSTHYDYTNTEEGDD